MKTYFVSDAHLGSWAFADKLNKEKKLVRWMDSIRDDCQALYLMGDMIDFWYEYRLAVPKGFARFFGKIAEFTDRGIPVHWFCGNHDLWLYDYVQEELGVQVHRGPETLQIGSKTFFLAHGDGLGDPTFTYKMLHWLFNSPLNRRLFSALSPRIGLWLGLKWAEHSRLKREPGPEKYLGEDTVYMVQFAKKDAVQKGELAPDFYVFGHQHILLDLMISSKSRILILGEWIHLYSYGVFDGETFSLEQWDE